MAHLHRLIALLGLLCAPFLAHSALPASTAINCTFNAYAAQASTHLGCAEALYAKAVAGGTPAGQCVTFRGIGAAGWFWTCGSGSQVTYGANTLSCPANSTLSGSSCTCNAPSWVESGGACVKPDDAFCNSKTGQPVKSSWTTTSPGLSARTICHSQGPGTTACNVTVEADICGSGDGGPVNLCHGSGTYGTGSCIASPTPEVPATSPAPESNWPTPPPPGTCPGQVNGVTVNVPCSRTETKGTKTTSENDGAGNVTNKSESKTTTCTAAGSCTTTTTTTTTVNGGSPTTTTKTTTEGKGKFCADNPGSKECGDGDGSAFGGSCDAGFICEGDAVQCAHAKETHVQNCKLNKDTPERQLYEASKGDEADFDNDDVVNVGPSSFSQTAILGAGNCIADKSITVMGSTVSLPFSNVCQYLAMLGNVLMAVGFLLSGRIIMRG